MAVSRSGSKSRTTPNGTRSGIPGAPPRTSFAKIREPLEVPNLLALQTESFDWLVGNDAWQSRKSERGNRLSGLEDILTELSPIE
ncbi:MAG: DNA-directed polymerase subunit beta, partial [Pseudonocardiales bacterium]|nr:DNA-directed polymerase subunit beta [Pseudonocardiales bacterium]